VLAIGQMLVHLIFFLHITTAPAQKTNILALLVTLLIIALMVIGSLWIMSQLNVHMMPMDQLMQMQR
ncbi:MAG TPA: cytochrome o ubiquinol oxidase subunit IV, partial [Acetobacteraceae bacterium]|nr:cytochrome o ubiquinol oxidase subunit IV [Acetobacteraceae bacterium]